MLSSLLTRGRGELVLRLGSHPSREALFTNAPLDNSEGRRGTELTRQQLDDASKKLTEVTEDMGAVVCAHSRVSYMLHSQLPSQVTLLSSAESPPRTHHLIRLPPASVAQVPEVRCAVVGNVDSGKSTTLGVLSRGALDDGRGRARVGLFRHKHEVESGRTSSVGMEVIVYCLSEWRRFAYHVLLTHADSGI